MPVAYLNRIFELHTASTSTGNKDVDGLELQPPKNVNGLNMKFAGECHIDAAQIFLVLTA